MRKSHIVILVLISVILASVAVVVGITPIKKGPIILDRSDSRLNPAPFDKVKSPLSGQALFILNNKELFREEIMKKYSAPKVIGETILGNIRFNQETGNLHQNEESVAVWGNYAVEGANDYRGGFGLLGGMSGYYVSNNNGSSILREGALPVLTGTEYGTGQAFSAYSGGDPVLDTNSSTGAFYYGSLYFDDNTNTWALGLAKSTPAKLANTGLTDSQVWEVTNVRADDEANQANDKEWIAVDNSVSSYKGKIYVTWTAFDIPGNTAKIWMARCNPSPLSCTTIHNGTDPVSNTQTDTQMSMVNIDSTGRVVVTWVEYNFISTTAPYYKTKLWYRVYSPGGMTALTSPRLIATVDKPVSFYYGLQGNEMRVPANVWSEVATVNNKPRLYTAYFKCAGSYLYDDLTMYADSCSNSNSYLKYIDNYHSATPTSSAEIGLETSTNAHSFWPTMSVNPTANRLDIAWYQTESSQKHDYYVAIQQRNLSNATNITQPTNLTYAGDPDSEVYFGSFGGNFGYVNGIFIGDYFQLVTKPGSPNRVYVGYNGNTRYASPITYSSISKGTFKMGGNQQDNMLYTKTY